MAWRETPVSPNPERDGKEAISTRGVSENRMIAGAEMEESESGEEDVAWERRNIVKESAKPTKAEVDEHMITHVPFRNLCPICVKGKSNVKGHYRRSTENCGTGSTSDKH